MDLLEQNRQNIETGNFILMKVWQPLTFLLTQTACHRECKVRWEFTIISDKINPLLVGLLVNKLIREGCSGEVK